MYFHELTKYHKILMQRNRLLKEIAYHPELADTLSVWDEQLVSSGEKIIRRRTAFIGELNEIIGEIHSNISGGKEALVLSYEPDVAAQELAEKLELSQQKDMRFCSTSVGPHRDDLSFRVNDADIRKYGSQGQQRTSALSLKLSEIELVKKVIHDTPVLLLDDVLSELDSSRQNYLLNSIHDIQTIITCTGLDEFVKNRFQINKVFHVKEGKIIENIE